jgi:hypothetical protein
LVLSFAYPVQAKPRFADGTPMASRDQDNYADGKRGVPYNPLG